MDSGGTAGATAGATAAAVTRAAPTIPDAPTFGSPDTASRAAVLEYARGVSFVTDPLLSDEQGMLLRGRRTATTARVEAAEHSRALTRAQLARGQIVARITSNGDYAPLGLGRGVHYMYVDSGSTGWRTVIIPDDAARRAHVMGMVIRGPAHTTDMPAVRWFEDGGFTIPNPSCIRECCWPCDDRLGLSCASRPLAPIVPPDIGGGDPRPVP